jgi:hypothetical protein
MSRYRLVAILVILVILASSQSATAVHSAAQGLVSSDSRFGAVESFFRPADAVEAGVGWERIIFEWRYLQPNSPIDWDTSHVPDQWLNDARRDGRMVVGLVKNAPHWATGSDLLGAVPLGLDLPIDDPGNGWAAFIRKLVRYYGVRWNIHHWIIYNEPDIRPEETQQFEFAGTVEDYYKVVKVAYKAAKAADPQAVIHLAGFTFWQDVVHERQLYAERFLRHAVSDPEGRQNNLFFDVLTVHAFPGTDWLARVITQTRSLPISFGFPKPVWINEFNARPTSDTGWPIRPMHDNETPITLEEQATFIVQGAALALALGVERIEVYKLFDNDVAEGYEAWGLVRADGSRRPGYYALKTVSQYFNATTKAQRYTRGGAMLVTLTQPGKTVYVIWNTTTEPLRARIKASRKDATGTQLVSVLGEVETPEYGEVAGGSYEFALPPCTTPCEIHGEPLILVQPGEPQAVWSINKGEKVKVN